MNPNCADNLRKLADDIEKHVPDGRIDMEAYVNVPDDVAEQLEDDKDWGDLPSEALTISRHCGTAFCALGWSAVFNPKIAAKCANYDELCCELFFPVFEKSGDLALDWVDVFGDDLSDDKAECIQRLRDKANEIDARGES